MARMNGKGMMQLWKGMTIIMQSTWDEAGGEHVGCYPLFVTIATWNNMWRFQIDDDYLVIDLRSIQHAAGNYCLMLRSAFPSVYNRCLFHTWAVKVKLKPTSYWLCRQPVLLISYKPLFLLLKTMSGHCMNFISHLAPAFFSQSYLLVPPLLYLLPSQTPKENLIEFICR